MRQERCLSGSLLQARWCLTTISMCAATFAAALNLQQNLVTIKVGQKQKQVFLGRKFKNQKPANESSESESNLMIGSLT